MGDDRECSKEMAGFVIEHQLDQLKSIIISFDHCLHYPLYAECIQFVKGYFRPVLTKEAEKVISSYYQLQRRSATQNAARARLMFRNEVTRLDAVTAILCIESSMTTSAIVDNAGNASHSNFTENPDQEYAKQEKLILEKLSWLDGFPHTNITDG